MNFRDMHEMYNAGHLLEASMAHYHYTGRRNFLDAMIKVSYPALPARPFAVRNRQSALTPSILPTFQTPLVPGRSSSTATPGTQSSSLRSCAYIKSRKTPRIWLSRLICLKHGDRRGKTKAEIRISCGRRK